MTFDELRARWQWNPIRHCPGRLVMARGPSTMSPAELIGTRGAVVEFQPSQARDPVIVGRLDRGGLISYRRNDGRYVHTLNSPEGFDRKLEQLGITLT